MLYHIYTYCMRIAASSAVNIGWKLV